MADALHIAGELTKSFEKPRPLPTPLKEKLRSIQGGEDLADHLQVGLRVHVIGADPVLATAVDNDIALRHMGFAQHLMALGRPGDVLLAISTSARSANVTNAARVACAIGMSVIVLTGTGPTTDLIRLGDIVVRSPAETTAEVQSHHVVIYHALCRAIEDSFFDM
jgi:phosphoheptose isomerase